jgi:uncharacterized protein (DUF433 family)
MRTRLPTVLVEHPHVTVDDIGRPFIRGTRVPVRRLWAWFRRGVPAETLIKRYPQLGSARVLGALAFAFDNRELVEADLALEAQLAPDDALVDVRQLPLPYNGVR